MSITPTVPVTPEKGKPGITTPETTPPTKTPLPIIAEEQQPEEKDKKMESEESQTEGPSKPEQEETKEISEN